MAKWKQVDGDRDFAGVGCTLARDDRGARQVELVRITPWLEMDSQAIQEGYGLWDVSKTTIDYNDMDLGDSRVKSAIDYSGLSKEQYVDLSPAHKAAVIAQASGFEESTSTNDFGKALPAPLGEIEFYVGTGVKEKIDDINRAMRREAVGKLFSRPGRRTPPSDKALTFAMGDEPLTYDLDDEELQAMRYALSVAKTSFTWPPAKDSDKALKITDATALRLLLEALMKVPESKDLDTAAKTKLGVAYARDFELDWEDKATQIEFFIDEDAENAHQLADNLLGELGFY